MKVSTLVLSLLALTVAIPAAYAQSALDSTADFGNQTNNTGNKTGAQAEQENEAAVGTSHDNWTYARSMQRNNTLAPDTLKTRTKGYLQGGLEGVSTELQAPFTVNNGAVPSGSFSLGFGGGKAQPYTGPYRSGFFGGRLPVVSTGSVDLDVTSGFGGFNLGGPDAASFQDMSRFDPGVDVEFEVQRPSNGDVFTPPPQQPSSGF